MSYFKLALVLFAIQFSQMAFAEESIFDQPVIMLGVGGESSFALRQSDVETLYTVECVATDNDVQVLQEHMKGFKSTNSVVIGISAGHQMLVHSEDNLQRVAIVCSKPLPPAKP